LHLWRGVGYVLVFFTFLFGWVFIMLVSTYFENIIYTTELFIALNWLVYFLPALSVTISNYVGPLIIRIIEKVMSSDSEEQQIARLYWIILLNKLSNLSLLILIELELLFEISSIKQTSIFSYFDNEVFTTLPWYECREDYFASDLI
jgi:hypothetical protein